ncbi:WD40 repeat domain-containing serine/threonine protein kinase [Streptomyces sp. NPDC049040]|uniref:WD40 repeat domain-containing serine/threonine protein kinase n=1 Tax=Streptomyces sp. NPDC049040 TaxID=3365593 RepID=UPI00371ABC5E
MSALVEPGLTAGGRYRLVGKLGADAAGEVWRAHDEHLRVDVAIKRFTLPADADRAEALARTAQQARTAARLREHPHVVAVYDTFTEDDVPWTVMQLVDGRSLREHLAVHGRLSVDRAADVARAVLKALAAAYTADVVHRNITPAAVILAAGGEVLLTDFGVARQTADDALTAFGVLVGTPGFVAPERLGGAEAGGAGDLFSLGVTLYEALEGELPFDPRIVTSVLHEEAPAPRSCGRLAPLITQLLRKDPEQRPTAVQALALLDTPRDTAPPAGREWQAVDRTSEADQLEGHTAQINALAFSADGSLLASGGEDKVIRLWDLRTSRVASTQLSDHTDWIRALAFSPDGSLLASGGDDKDIRLWDISTGRPFTVKLTGHTGWIRALAFSPDGSLLASAGGDRVVRLWDVASGSSAATLSGHTGWIRALAFSPDGTMLATGGNDKVVRLWHVASGRKVSDWPETGGRVHAVAFSPDGTTVAAAGASGVRMSDVATLKPVPAWTGVGAKIRSLAFGPDGTTLATGGKRRKVTMWDVATATPTVTWKGTYGTARSVVHSPDGTLVASADYKSVRLWHPAVPSPLLVKPAAAAGGPEPTPRRCTT